MTSEEDQAPGHAPEQTQAQRNANLARIRDNQRRSRARRKDYLQELEVKYRACEQSGVEASAEIQAAARRVVDENKRLRQLLKQQGLSDVDIDGMAVDTTETPPYPTAASGLESMIGQRKSCGSGSDCGGNTAGGRRFSCDPSPPSRLPTQPPNTLQRPPQQSQLPTQSQPKLEPQHIPQPLPAPSPQYPSPLSAASTSIPTASNAQFAPHAASYGTSNAVLPQPLEYDFQYNEPFQWDNHYKVSQPTTGGSSSCYVAAGAIRNIKPDIGYELETELGCGDGQECEVPNSRIFSIMDRYTE